MTVWKKILAWLLIAASYACLFVTPMVSAYFLLAEDVASSEHRGGFFFYLVFGVAGGLLVITVTKIINKQKANFVKSFFRTIVKLFVFMGLIALVKYINFNIDQLENVIYISIAGAFVGSLFEMFAVTKYKDYIRELGVF